ncbi:hypothetical protein N9J72_01595 [Candidatus Gracilibacteria bacterium]|nr:hypothetical protein [Candidatus Gracilibacteria bacterium]
MCEIEEGKRRVDIAIGGDRYEVEIIGDKVLVTPVTTSEAYKICGVAGPDFSDKSFASFKDN